MNEVLVNNWRVTWFGRFWLAKILCWHGTKHLRLLMASNGGEIYCTRCGMKRVGWVYDPRETREGSKAS